MTAAPPPPVREPSPEEKALAAAYRAHVAWEPPAALDARTAALLPGLLLARVDGKSPVEYLTADMQRDTRSWEHNVDGGQSQRLVLVTVKKVDGTPVGRQDRSTLLFQTIQ